MFTEGSNIKVRSAETLIVDDVFSLADLVRRFSRNGQEIFFNILFISLAGLEMVFLLHFPVVE